MSTKHSLALALLAVTPILAQSRPARLEFEVAAIRPTTTVARAIRIDGAQVHFTGFLLREYIARAYQVRVSQIIGPDWLSSTRFDVDAKFPEGSTPAQATDMLQALLADRFSLKQHREQKVTPVYAIVIGKPPLRLRDSVTDPNASSRVEALTNITVDTSGGKTAVDLGHGSSYTIAGGRFEGKRFTGAMLALVLERYCDRPILDMTNLTKVFDFSFEVTAEESQVLGMRAALYAGVHLPAPLMDQLDSGGNPVTGALQQLGLKLDPRMAPVDVLVVDDMRQTPREN
jgi:uncharacterized protein (TIGR03435 family)